MMKPTGILVAIAVALGLQACGTAPARSQADSQPMSIQGEAATRIDPSRVTIAKVEWEVAADAGIDDQERSTLTSHFRDALSDAVRGLPAVTEGRAAELHAYISDVNTVSPALNLLSAAVLLLPLDGGGATVRLEAVDPVTGERLMSRQFAYKVPLTAVRTRFHRMSPANTAIDRAAEIFAAAVRDTPVPAESQRSRFTMADRLVSK